MLCFDHTPAQFSRPVKLITLFFSEGATARGPHRYRAASWVSGKTQAAHLELRIT